jgi:predicted nucleotidyltransferase
VSLTPDLDVARAFLDAHPPPGEVLVCAVTGAHLYGFPSPDSDLDLKGIHVAPTERLLGLTPDLPAHDITAWHDGVECDLTTNEVGAALKSMLAGNGNMLERILSPLQVVRHERLASLRQLAEGSFSRRCARHYSGFFTGRIREHERQPTVKTLLYSYRVALTGIHLLRTGELQPDVASLAPQLGFPEVAELIELKAASTEHGGLDPAIDARHRESWPRLQDELSAAEASSPLPTEPPNAAEVEGWLIALRRDLLA